MNNVASRRIEKQLSQCQLASKLGISPSYLSKIERGHKTKIPTRLAIKIASSLESSVETLFGDDISRGKSAGETSDAA